MFVCMKHQVMAGVVLVSMAAGVAAAGTPPAIRELLETADGYYRQDATTKVWTFTGDQTIANDGYEYGCAAILAKAKKDGVADTLSVDVPFDTPLWPRGQHTVAELRTYCDHARRTAAVAMIVSGFKMGQDDDTGDLAARCMDWYEQRTRQFKLAPTTELPYDGVGRDLKDPATGDPFKGTLEAGRKKFCDPYAKEWLAEKAKAEAPYRKALTGARLQAALQNLVGDEVRGAGGNVITIPQMAKAKVWFRLKKYTDQRCTNGAFVYGLERYTFTAKNDDYTATQSDSCGQPAKSAYK